VILVAVGAVVDCAKLDASQVAHAGYATVAVGLDDDIGKLRGIGQPTKSFDVDLEGVRIGDRRLRQNACRYLCVLSAQRRDDVASWAEARARIGSFIETVYNRQRLHSALDYLSPEEYELNAPRSRRSVPTAAISITETCP
jgi:hypothetical protein